MQSEGGKVPWLHCTAIGTNVSMIFCRHRFRTSQNWVTDFARIKTECSGAVCWESSFPWLQSQLQPSNTDTACWVSTSLHILTLHYARAVRFCPLWGLRITGHRWELRIAAFSIASSKFVSSRLLRLLGCWRLCEQARQDKFALWMLTFWEFALWMLTFWFAAFFMIEVEWMMRWNGRKMYMLNYNICIYVNFG